MNSTHPFVGRDHQLVQLDTTMDAVLGGEGRVRFVVGEAGSGKTALVGEFARLAQDRHSDLIVAVGQSDAQTGIGDPYLPFRELLALLTGDVDGQLAKGAITEENARRLTRFLGISGEAIIDLGPDLIGTLIPGVGLATRLATYVARKTGRLERIEELSARRDEGSTPDRGGIEQSHIFEQYTNLIMHLAEQQPLLLVLDDLQWADAASTALLFRLGRSIQDSRILLIGTFRPAEVAIGHNGERHPLQKVLAEFKRLFGDIVIDLGDVGLADRRRLVDALLDSAPNHLSQAFRDSLFDHTAGHPLFTTELVRAMQERGDLVRDAAGRWVERGPLHWDELPPRVEGVIQERIGRLDDDARETLTVASVEGEEFTAEVVASVRDIDARYVVRRLGRDLEQQHGLVRSEGVRRLNGHGIRMSIFAFHHNLFHHYLYGTLNEAERAYLHEDVGSALEELYAERPDDVVVQLAWHFAEAGVTDKAATYLRRAGELALACYANDEAASYLTLALELTPEADDESRWDVLRTLELIHGLQGDRTSQADDIDTMRRIAANLHDQARTEVALRASALAYAVGDYPRAIEAANEAIRLGAPRRDIAREARARIEWGYALLEQGRNTAAQEQLEHAYALADGAGLHRIQPRTLNGLARIHSERGEFQRASSGYREALRICQRLKDSLGETNAVNSLGIAAARQGNFDQAMRYFEDALERKRRIGDRRGEGRALHNLGEVASEQHDLATARRRYGQSLRIASLAGDVSTECASRTGLGGVAIRLGLYDEASDHLLRSLAATQSIGQLRDTGDALAWLATLALRRGDHAGACQYARKASAIATDLAEPLLAGWSLDLLGRGLEGLGRLAEAEEVYEDSLSTRDRFRQTSAATEPRAGIARVAFARGDLETAHAFTLMVLEHLDQGHLARTIFPVEIYLTCFRVLDAAGDPRATSVLVEGRDYLLGIADRIEDPEMRNSFLESVAAHREIRSLAAAAAP